MADQIGVLIVDDIPETREHLSKLLGFEPDIKVVGLAGSGAEAIEMAETLRPDALLLDINMPDMDGIATAEQLTLRVPTSALIMMSVQGEADYLRRSMLAGAREFLVKPFSSDELVASLRQVVGREREKMSRVAVSAQPASDRSAEPPRSRRSGRVITVFAGKGGVGRTTLAVNLAAAGVMLKQKVVLVDGSLQFGDVGMMLNLDPKNKSLADVARAAAAGEPDPLDGALVHHSTGIDVLLAPPSPEMAELVTAEQVNNVLVALRGTYDLIVVDAWPWLHDTTLAVLDGSDVILAMLTLEITGIKNTRQFLAVVDQLGYPPDKIELLLNRSDAAYGIRAQDVERSIGRRIEHTVVSDGRTVVTALNRGQPFVMASPQAKVSQDVMRVARALVDPQMVADTDKPKPQPTSRRSLLAWR
jgi:pilus assembly protein CpaE